MKCEQEDTKEHRDQPEKTDLPVRKLRNLQEGRAPAIRGEEGHEPLQHEKKAERNQQRIPHAAPYFFAPPGALKYFRYSEFGSISNTSLRVLKLSL